MVKGGSHIRVDKSFRILLREAKLEFIKKGRHPPSDSELTKSIARRVKKEDILYDEFIKF